MDAQQYALSKESIKTLKVDNYAKSRLVVLLNLAMLGIALSLFFSGNNFLCVCIGHCVTSAANEPCLLNRA